MHPGGWAAGWVKSTAVPNLPQGHEGQEKTLTFHSSPSSGKDLTIIDDKRGADISDYIKIKNTYKMTNIGKIYVPLITKGYLLVS